MSKEEEERLGFLEGRIVANVDFDDDALLKLGFHSDIYQLLDHLGWTQFSNGVTVHVHKELALEILMTMKPEITEEGVACLSFRLEDVEQVIPYDYIRELLSFKKNAPELVEVQVGQIEEFWGMISEKENRQRNSIKNIIIQVFHSWMSKRIMGRMRETKITDTELNWLYAGLVARQEINPTYIMINRWACEAVSGRGSIGSGCYLTMLAIALKPTIRRNPQLLLIGTSLGIDYLRQGKYISGDEKKGFRVAVVNIPLPDMKLKLFVEGREDWLGDEPHVAAKKSKRGVIIEEGSSSAAQGGQGATFQGAPSGSVPTGWTGAPYGGVPMPHYGGIPSPQVRVPMQPCGGVPMQAWGSGMPMGPPPPMYGQPGGAPYIVPNAAFVQPYSHLVQPQQSAAIIGAYVERNMQDAEIVHSHVNNMQEGTANITYQLGRLHLMPPEEFHGGPMQHYYEQGYNEQPPQE